MKSNFALSLSFDGLRLMHRVAGGWHLVGEVALDDTDLNGSMARLQSAALHLEPSGIHTKLLIPNDQIRYIALDTTRAEDEDVRGALDGATPYAVDDLVYDFAKGGGRTYIAAVARETLDEACAFARDHGFNPMEYAAIPEPFTFVGEAHFGGIDGATPQRDEEPVYVIGVADTVLEVETAPELEPSPEPEPEAEPATEAGPAASEVPVSGLVAEAEHDAKPETPDEPVPVPEPDETPEPDPTPPVKDPVPEPVADPIPEPEADPEPVPVSDPEPEPETDSEPQEAPADAAPMFATRLRAVRGAAQGGNAPATSAPAKARKPDTSNRAEPSLSRETTQPAPPPPLAVPTGLNGSGAGHSVPPLAAASRDEDTPPATTVQPISTVHPEPEAAPPITGEPAAPLTEVAASSAASLIPDRAQAGGQAQTAVGSGGAAKVMGAVGAVGGMFASRRPKKAASPTGPENAAQAEAAAAEKSKMTVFGARKKAGPSVGGKPRFLGLILTAILLLFLLAIAAFAALSEEGLARWFGGDTSETQIAATPPVPVAAPETDVTELAALEFEAPEPDVEPAALSSTAAPSGGQILTPEEAQRIYAATGVWQRAARLPVTPRTTSLDTMTLAVALQPVVRVPASPLADAGSIAGDAVIPTPVNPPPPSAEFEFDSRGFIAATPQGALTPDGILVIAGRPAVSPPARPGTIAPTVEPLDLLAAVMPEDAAPLSDAPEGVLLIAGRPAVSPPPRPGTEPPAAEPQELLAAVIPDDAAPILDGIEEGVLLIAGAPSVLPPVRPGTEAPEVIPEPEVEQAAANLSDAAPSPDEATETSIADAVDTVLANRLNIVAGAPPVVPPLRDDETALDALPDAQAEAEAVAEAVATASLRPLLRPASVIQTAAATTAAPPTVGDLTPSEAAAFRPRTRPAGLAPPPAPPEPDAEAAPEPEAAPQPAAAPATQLQISPEIAAAVAQAAARPDPFATATNLAIPQSLRPDPRPRNMDRIVARATQNQQRVTAAAAAAPATAATAVAPSGPTAGTVAQTATLTSAINLREINLIGIYGGSGDRRALVRLSNGRYARVTVGDRLDGGQVTAISADVLTYNKRGRAINLRVPG